MKFHQVLLVTAALAFAAEAPPEPAEPEVAGQAAPTQEAPAVAEAQTAAEAPETEPGQEIPEPQAAPSQTEALQGEVALRDSLLAASDSARAAERAQYETDLDVQTARCENWEKSYATVENEYRLCSKALGVYVESTEKYKKEKNQRDMVGTAGSFVGGLLIGVLIGFLVWN